MPKTKLKSCKETRKSKKCISIKIFRDKIWTFKQRNTQERKRKWKKKWEIHFLIIQISLKNRNKIIKASRAEAGAFNHKDQMFRIKQWWWTCQLGPHQLPYNRSPLHHQTLGTSSFMTIQLLLSQTSSLYNKQTPITNLIKNLISLKSKKQLN